MTSQYGNQNFQPWGMNINQFNMFMHLAQFAGYIIPLAGLILPLVMWLTNRDFDRQIDEHGKNIMNFIISSLIYYIIGFVLTCLFIGYPILLAIFICSIIFPIIGAVRASEGILYNYPLTIKFIR